MGASRIAATRHHLALTVLLAGTLLSAAAPAQTTLFTYQGQLTDAGAPANGNYDLQFALFDAAAGGTQIGATLTRSNVAASNGVFTVQLDFGVTAFPGADRFLEIGVRPAGGGTFTTLAPRQQIGSSPYAIRTLSAATADMLSSTCTACVQDAQIKAVTGSKVTGTIPVASVPAGSGNYIQNTTTQQAGANFNVGGNGTIGGNLTVNGTLNANVSGNFIQNRTTPQANSNFDISGSGTLGGTLSASKVGVGTTTPTTPLDVRGNVTLDAGADPIVYTGTSNAEQNRYVDLINSPASPSASGLKAGGVLVADSYSFANPAKNDLIVKGNAGIGTAAPDARLHVSGRTGLGTPFHGLAIDQTLLSTGSLSGYSLQIRTSDHTIQPFTDRTDLLIDSLGNMGLGTATPTSKLEIAAQDGLKVTGSGPYFTLRDTESGSNVDSYIQGVNGALVFIPQSFHLQNSAAMVILNGSGNVGIGTGTPTAARLQVNDTAVGTAVYGVSATGSGVVGESKNPNGWGVYGQGAGYAMYANGNAGQARDKGGWAKAMAYIRDDGVIRECYNSQVPGGSSLTDGTSADGCGFHVDHPFLGDYEVDFGFFVQDRFYAVTAHHEPHEGSGGQANIGASFGFFGPNVIEVQTWYSDAGKDEKTDAGFMIIVF
ncbi:MAG TPA: hypothetical protein VMW56_15830 [Candidatus Margulisiibacteriota bacterium]|nr:hypothetical protein [Candidatus Margulisiibacteriota bacterium]